MGMDRQQQAAQHPVIAQAMQEWRRYLEPLLSLPDRIVPQMLHADDAQLRRELYREMFSQLLPAYFGLLHADPRHPDFWPFTTPCTAYAGANPDHDYYITPLDDDGVYCISGYRGTVRRIDAQVGTGTFFSRGMQDENRLGLTLDNFNIDDLQIAADGFFSVVLSRERPNGYGGDWWPLKEKARYLLMRQTAYDWEREADGRVAIERLDTPAARPRPDAEQLERDLQQLAVWAESWLQLSINFVAQIRRDQGINRIGYKDLREYGELLTQRYAYGGFELATDEALLVEARVPERCRYWSIHLMDDHGFTLDWVHRHTHLNGHMAQVDADGVFRGVISAQDPGVPNWLDTMGYATGTVQVRWEDCSHWPDHTVQRIKLSDLPRHLPASTPRVSLTERDAILRARRRGAQWRKRW